MLHKKTPEILLSLAIFAVGLMAALKFINYLSAVNISVPDDQPPLNFDTQAENISSPQAVETTSTPETLYNGKTVNTLQELESIISLQEKELEKQPLVAEVQNYEYFQLHPFTVSQQSDHHEWTEADGKTPEAMRALSHTEEEYQRLTQENKWVDRRQLVYRKKTIGELSKQIEKGEKIEQVILPGFDGVENIVKITHSEKIKEKEGGNTILISGYLEGNKKTAVSIAYVDGVESVLLIPEGGSYYIEMEPREPGQVVLKKVIVANMPSISEDDEVHPF